MNQLVTLLCLLLVLSATAYRQPWSRTAQVSESQYAVLSNEVGYRLQRVQSGQPGNQLISPYGVSTLLGLLYEGATGETQQQIGRLGYYQLEQQGEGISQSYRQLRGYLQRYSGSELQEATAVLYPSQYTFTPQYREVLESSYRCLVQRVDYRQRNEDREQINRWVEQQTGGKLSQILNGLYASSGLTLLNGVYYRGLIRSQSYQQQIQQLPFYSEGETPSQSALYYQTQAIYPYYQDEQVQAVQLPSQDGAYNILVLLPRQQVGVRQLQQQVSSSAIQRILADSQETPVKVSFPQFRLDYSQTLQRDIQSLGVTSVFGPQAELSGVDPRSEAYVSLIGQRAVVEFVNYGGDQEGQYRYGSGQGGEYGQQYSQYGYGDSQGYQYGGQRYDAERRYRYEYGEDQYENGQEYGYGYRYGQGDDNRYGSLYGYGAQQQYEGEQDQYRYPYRVGQQGEYEGQYPNGYGQEGQYNGRQEYGYQYGSSGQGGVAEFTANRPFLFYVVHNPTGLNVLAGRISQL